MGLGVRRCSCGILFVFLVLRLLLVGVPVSGEEMTPECKQDGCTYKVNASHRHLELADVVFLNPKRIAIYFKVEVDQNCSDSSSSASVPLSIVIRNWTSDGIVPDNFFVYMLIIGKVHTCDYVSPLQVIISGVAPSPGLHFFALQLQRMSFYGADSYVRIENSAFSELGLVLNYLVVHHSALMLDNITTYPTGVRTSSDTDVSVQLSLNDLNFAFVSVTNSRFYISPSTTTLISAMYSTWNSVAFNFENLTFSGVAPSLGMVSHSDKEFPLNGDQESVYLVSLAGGNAGNNQPILLQKLSFRNVHVILNGTSINCLLHLSSVNFYDARVLVENVRIENIQEVPFSCNVFVSDATYPISLTRSSLTFRDISFCGRNPLPSIVVMDLNGDATMYVRGYSTIEFDGLSCVAPLRLTDEYELILSQSALLFHNISLQDPSIAVSQGKLVLEHSSLLRFSHVINNRWVIDVTSSSIIFSNSLLQVTNTTSTLFSLSKRGSVQFLPTAGTHSVTVSRSTDFQLFILQDPTSFITPVTLALYCSTLDSTDKLEQSSLTLPCSDAEECNVDADCFAPNTVGVSGHAGNCQCDCRETDNAIPSMPALCVGYPTPVEHVPAPHSHELSKWVLALIVSSTVFVALLSAVFLFRKSRNRRDPFQSVELPTQEVVGPSDIIAGQYKINRFLGKGGFGQVYLAECVTPSDTDESSRVVAVKVLHCIDEHALMTAVNECKNMRAVEGHPGIVSMKDMIVDRKESPNSSAQERAVESLSGTSYDSTTVPLTGTRVTHTLYLVMTYYAGGTLEDALKRNPDYYGSTRSISSFLMDVLGAVGHAHRQNIIHRDLKPSNILLNRYRDVASVASSINDDLSDDMGDEFVVSDFGMARNLEHSVETRGIGSIYYLAPEQLDMRVSKKSDVWAIACVCVVMASYGVRCKRKDDANGCDLGAGKKRAFWMRRGDADFEDSLRVNELCDTPAPLVDLLLAMLSANPLERPTIEECDDCFLAI